MIVYIVYMNRVLAGLWRWWRPLASFCSCGEVNHEGSNDTRRRRIWIYTIGSVLEPRRNARRRAMLIVNARATSLYRRRGDERFYRCGLLIPIKCSTKAAAAKHQHPASLYTHTTYMWAREYPATCILLVLYIRSSSPFVWPQRRFSMLEYGSRMKYTQKGVQNTARSGTGP